MPRSSPSFQQRQCEGAGTGQNRSPPPQPNQPGAGAKSGRNMASLRLGKLPEECLRGHRVCGVPSRLKGETNVESSATWAPWKSGKPFATTSNRRASTWCNGNKSKSRTITFVVPWAPASRETRAAALSRTHPRRPNTPACAQAARWSATPAEARRGYGEPKTHGKGRHRNVSEVMWNM